MSGIRVWEVVCDFEHDDGRPCDASCEAVADTLGEVRRIAAKVYGWKVEQPNSQDFCPEHAAALAALGA